MEKKGISDNLGGEENYPIFQSLPMIMGVVKVTGTLPTGLFLSIFYWYAFKMSTMWNCLGKLQIKFSLHVSIRFYLDRSLSVIACRKVLALDCLCRLFRPSGMSCWIAECTWFNGDPANVRLMQSVLRRGLIGCNVVQRGQTLVNKILVVDKMCFAR